MTCVKYLSEGVKRVGKESIKWNEYVSDGVWSSDLHSALHTHRAAVTPSPSGYNKVSQWYSEPRRLSHLRHLSVCACTLHSLIQPTSALSFFVPLALSLLPAPTPVPYFQNLHFTPSLYVFSCKLIKISSFLYFLPISSPALASFLFHSFSSCGSDCAFVPLRHNNAFIVKGMGVTLVNTVVWDCICVCTSDRLSSRHRLKPRPANTLGPLAFDLSLPADNNRWAEVSVGLTPCLLELSQALYYSLLKHINECIINQKCKDLQFFPRPQCLSMLDFIHFLNVVL